MAGVEPGVILGGGVLLSALIIFFLFGATILTVVITVVYPAFKSIKALESKEDDTDDKEWLTYWTMFGLFTLFDEFGGILLSFIPFYFYVKLVFFIFLMAPQTKGALKLYEIIVGPLLRQHKDKIQNLIDEVKGSAGDVAQGVKEQAMKEMNDPANLLKAAAAAKSAQDQINKLNEEAAAKI